jgi:hypothetical protein
VHQILKGGEARKGGDSETNITVFIEVAVREKGGTHEAIDVIAGISK